MSLLPVENYDLEKVADHSESEATAAYKFLSVSITQKGPDILLKSFWKVRRLPIMLN